MQVTTALAIFLVLQCCDLCFTIQVPIVWNNGDVQQQESRNKNTIEAIKFQNENQKPIPVEYFEYTAKKPQFAINIAASHGVLSPENHYKAHPVKPKNGIEKQELGTHKLLDKERNVYQTYQKYVENNVPQHVIPISSNYEIFHPYKAEKAALQEIYKDPVLQKIRNDLENNKNRLQNYEKEASQGDITKDEYLENPELTDQKLFPQKNIPVEFENHRPQRRPIYYKVEPKPTLRDKVLNQKLRHPWNQNFVKIRPIQYQPLKKHINHLRQHHASKYDDERNEYPQIQVLQNTAGPEDGYDIYERGKQKYAQLRNNFDESINKAVLKNRPSEIAHLAKQLEQQNSDTEKVDEEDDFVPIKNYAQVRKTETIKHLPREAALQDAETYEEIRNAPRLREAVKSTKAQIVYTEEGYEDSAYDHAGEQKQASDHEGHAGYLKQQESSEGKYKIPSVSASYDDGKGSEYRDKVSHGEKWKDNKKNNEEQIDEEDYSEVEKEHSVESDIHNDKINKDINRNKRENENSNNEGETQIDHDVNKQKINFEVPDINLNSTFLSEQEILNIATEKLEPKKDDTKDKYPYYFKNLNTISKHSPLRYAENFNLIPNKSKGGTEFYDSRSKFECPEVDDVDPLPEDMKNAENPNEDSSESDKTSQEKRDNNFDIVKQQPRLRGLGNKIDCFKAKFFGENPLDNPFFKEDIIADPEPVAIPNLEAYKLQQSQENSSFEPNLENIGKLTEKLEDDNKTNIFILLDRLRRNQNNLTKTEVKENDKLRSLRSSKNNFEKARDSHVYSDILNNIKNNQENLENEGTNNTSMNFVSLKKNEHAVNTTYNFFRNKEEVMKTNQKLRKKRATPFIYEPYKIIRETQTQDTKKPATVGNISPLIKQLQTSRVVDRVTRANPENENSQSASRSYTDIGRDDRTKNTDIEETSGNSFIDINVDQRRGEPRYELMPINHKTEYIPVENKKSISVEEYKTQSNTEKPSYVKTTQRTTQIRRNSRQRRPTTRPTFDVSKFIPTTTTEVQDVAASNNIKKAITTTTSTPDEKITSQTSTESQESGAIDESGEEYEEYDEEQEVTTTTSTTTQKPAPRRRIRISTTTRKSVEEISTQAPKLQLVTRFRNYNHDDTVLKKEKQPKRPIIDVRQRKTENDEFTSPKYREKKKKSSKSTIVTDTKKYGNDDGDDDDDNMRKEEVDALIGIKHDIDDYIPLYEKEAKSKYKHSQELSSEESTEDDDDNSDDNRDDNRDDNNNDENDEELEEEEDEDEKEEITETTTPEPTKRTLIRTTDAPKPTVASYSASLEPKPVISKKTIEIHKELPVNKSSPHRTEFKQDIKEIEIIKEIPPLPQKQDKHTEVLDLFKDDNLATDINKLDDVEVFKLDLNLKNGPRHGGNYRRAPEKPESAVRKKLKDAETSQSENTKHIELTERPPTRMHGGNLKSINDFSRSRNTGRNAKLIDLSDVTQGPPRAMHGGNLRLDSKTRRGGRRYEKLIELDDDLRKEDSASNEDNYKTYSSRNGGAMHGGNYRSAKIVEDNNADSEYDIKVKTGRVKDPRRSAAVLLNSFAQAVPILTTTPGYILDPSKRMYYYVET